MKKHLSKMFIISICLVSVTGQPCTTFVLDNGTSTVVGKNFDYHNDIGFLIVNKRGVAKTTVPNGTEPVATWTSTYGSVTFNFVAREMPFEGINEAGLNILGMAGGDISELPEPDSRPLIGVEQWIQYQLDNFSTVEEVIASDKDIRIETPVYHFLVSDGTGKSAVIEFLKGIQVCYTRETMPYKVLTNSTYDQSVAFLKWFWGYG